MSDINSLDDAFLISGGWVEFDLGILEYTRLQKVSVASATGLAREIVLAYLADQDPDGVELRRAAKEIVDSVPSDAVLSDRSSAVLAECRAVLDGEGIAVVRSRFAEGWPPWISCSPGWYRIILDLDREIASVDAGIRYMQIKEKFGGLRVYVEGGGPEIEALIRGAKEGASRTCEVCGLGGVLRDDRPYIQTLCEHHADAPRR